MLFHKICSDTIGMGYVALFLRVVELQALKMLQIVANDAEYIQETKINLLRGLNTPEDEIKFIKNIDRQTLDTWRETVILHFIAAYPEKYRHQLEFADWGGAMRQIKYIERKQNQKKHFN
tara:strand:+ start:527 stop:886 length:360 start_codon:yes stop_codon:yes gene_type:complete